jgi:hypothetical protein
MRFGFDFANRMVTFFDDGNTRITVSTWPQTALCLSRILALQLHSSSGPSISQYETKQVLVTSFILSQQDMFESVLRVTGDEKSDWTIRYEDAKQRFSRGMRMLQQGNFDGFNIAMYSRAFFRDDPMNHEENAANLVLNLPKEDLDEATKLAISMAGGNQS